MLQQKLLPAVPSHHIIQHIHGTQWQDAAADMHVTDAGKLWLFPEKVAFLQEWFFQRHSTMHGGKLPAKELGKGQEVELKSGKVSGHCAQGWAIPPFLRDNSVTIFFSHEQVLSKRCYYAPKKGASCTLTAAPTNSCNIMLEKRNRLFSLPSLALPPSTISMH